MARDLDFCLVENFADSGSVDRPIVWCGSLGNCQRMMHKRYEEMSTKPVNGVLGKGYVSSSNAVLQDESGSWCREWYIVAPDPAEYGLD